MPTILFQILILVLASLFSGLTIFLSTVLRGVFNDLPEAAFHDVFARVIHFGRRSIYINILVLAPLLLLIVYIFFFKGLSFLFVIGGMIFIVGSLVLSRFMNEPTYDQFLKTQRDDIPQVAHLRARLNRLNIARASVSTLGVILMAASIILKF